MISVECSIYEAAGLPDMISKTRTMVGFIGSISAKTSPEMERWRLLRNSIRRPDKVGVETFLPS